MESNIFFTKEKTRESFDVAEQEVELHEILLFNDDVNTFDFVIDALIEVCEHTMEQAEQCTYLVHYKGKCAVKTGEYEELKPKCTSLLNRGLSAEIV
jgi:ATP-dependent Clp protease adaptor protein ClpS